MKPSMPGFRRRRVAAEVETDKRFVKRQWARRWLVWRVVVAALLGVAVVVGAAWLVFFSSVLAVEGVGVQGNELLTKADVRSAAAVTTGEPLARANLDAVRARIEALPAVKSVDVSRQWPDQILVRVTERRAVAVIEVDGRFRGMDETGVVFRNFAHAPKTLPRIRVAADTRGEAMAEGAAVIGVLPAHIARKIDYVQLETVDQITLVLRDGRKVLWGSAEQSEDKARVLDVLLKHEANEYDVSVPGQPTTR